MNIHWDCLFLLYLLNIDSWFRRCWELNAGNIKWIYQTPILVAIGVRLLVSVFVCVCIKHWTLLYILGFAKCWMVTKRYRKCRSVMITLVFIFRQLQKNVMYKMRLAFLPSSNDYERPIGFWHYPTSSPLAVRQ